MSEKKKKIHTYVMVDQPFNDKISELEDREIGTIPKEINQGGKKLFFFKEHQ